MDPADFREKATGCIFLVATLVVANQFIRLMPATLDRHAEGMVLGDIVLIVADMVA